MKGTNYFVNCSVLSDDNTRARTGRSAPRNLLSGCLVSSLHKLKDRENVDGGFFVFGDISIKQEGTYRLRFSLYKNDASGTRFIRDTASDPFTVYPTKSFPGMQASTGWTRTFSDQGIKLRLRKDPVTRKDGPASNDYNRRTYNASAKRRRTSQDDVKEDSDATPAQSLSHHSSYGDQYQSNAGYNYTNSQETTSTSRPSLAGTTSFGSMGDDHSGKRARLDTEPGHLWSTTYATQPTQYLAGQPSYTQSTSQAMSLPMTVAPSTGMMYSSRDQITPYSQRRDNFYQSSGFETCDMSTNRATSQYPPTTYFGAPAPAPSAYSALPTPPQTVVTATPASLPQGYHTQQQPQTQRVNSLDLPQYGTIHGMPRSYTASAMNPSYRGPSFGQGTGYGQAPQLSDVVNTTGVQGLPQADFNFGDWQRGSSSRSGQ